MVRPSAGGGIAGFIADNFLGTFPLGTLAGTFHKALFSLGAQDMDQAYDPGRATRGGSPHPTGDLKGMLSGLFAELQSAFNQGPQGGRGAFGQGDSGPGGHHDGHRDAAGEGPRTHHDAMRMGRPQVNDGARTQAQGQSGLGGWGKALLYGGLALGGLTLLRDFSMGGFGLPFYGGMTPYMTPGMPYMPGIFW